MDVTFDAKNPEHMVQSLFSFSYFLGKIMRAWKGECMHMQSQNLR